MVKNYFTIAIRNLMRHKGYSLINVLGLAIGMACCVLILLFVQDEISYDRHHTHVDRVHRITREFFQEDGASFYHFAAVPPMIGPLMETEYPGLKAARFTKSHLSMLLRAGEKAFYENRVYFADAAALEVFTFPMRRGNSETALMAPFKAVMTESAARKYFGDVDPIGQMLRVENEVDFEVVGIVADMPRTTHLKFDVLLSLETLAAIDMLHSGHDYLTYLLLPKGLSGETVNKQLPAFYEKHIGAIDKGEARNAQFHLQKLKNIHLGSHLMNEAEPNSDVAYVYIFLAVSIFVLLIACINFMNLSTARSATRSREVGLRKVVGAHRDQLIRQFLGEAMMMAFLALGLAMATVELALPWFNAFVGKELVIDAGMLVGMLGLTVLVGLLAGSYPALFLSGFRPIAVLKGQAGSARGGLRKGLVVVQFAISILLIIGTGVVYSQLQYVENKRLGLDKDQVVIVPHVQDAIRGLGYDTIRNEFLKHSDVLHVAASKYIPSGQLLDGGPMTLQVPGYDKPRAMKVRKVPVTHDFPETFGLTFVAGGTFTSKDEQPPRQVVLNETALKLFGFENVNDAIGLPVEVWDREGTVVGVVEDYHFETLKDAIRPAALVLRPDWCRYMSVKIQGNQVAETLERLKATWAGLQRERPFEFTFLDENFDRLYRSEQKRGQIFGVFALLAIFIACLGLFGLASFAAERRTKEIGVRKILGASVPNLVMLFSRDFIQLIVIANVIAWPAAYWMMEQWLREFAYRTSLDFTTFIISTVLALAIALLTVSVQAIRAARANPIDALRYE